MTVLPTRRWLAPEVVQSSEMDCGPAALACLLAGHRLPVSYAGLRDACQTDLDGTSISTMAVVANELGLYADEVLVPADHVLSNGNTMLPAIAVVNNPDGSTHFVVLWRTAFGRVQVMDPATGRRWPTKRELVSSLYEHVEVVSAREWRAWAGSDEFIRGLETRMSRLGIRRPAALRWRRALLDDPGFRTAAAVDAAVRTLASLKACGSVRDGAEAESQLSALLASDDGNPGEDADAYDHIPRQFWSVRPVDPDDEAAADIDEPCLYFRGALLVRVEGRRATLSERSSDVGETREVSAELHEALVEDGPRPMRALFEMLGREGVWAPALLIGALALTSVGLLAQALLFRGLIELASVLGLPDQRLTASLVLMSFLVLMFLIEIPVATGSFRIGRRLDGRFRMALYRKVPRLVDRYFKSRLVSDTAHRGHGLHALRSVPVIAAELARNVMTVLCISAAIWFWVPESAWLAVVAAVMTLGVPLLFQPALAERDLRVQTHEGALSRFYLDALCGLVPLRAHGASRPLRRQHERLLVQWTRARLSHHRVVAVLQGLQYASGYTLAAMMLVRELTHPDGAASVLLLAYWALQFPALGASMADLASRVPALRNTTGRLLEPLDAPERGGLPSENQASSTDVRTGGVHVSAAHVSVRASGLALLEDLSFELRAGEHIAVVGASGAGKSSLLGLLHGWVEPCTGTLTVDGRELDETTLSRLREETAWVDPSVQLWNRTLLGNVEYGSRDGQESLSMSGRLELSELKELLETLPDGQQGVLGESGGLVSGGEAQRLRFARALGRPKARLVLLDEPFRGLTRDQRKRLLERARSVWRGATVVCVTHDVRETRGFDRVLVLDGGRLVEDGAPRELLDRVDSRYRELVASEKRCDAVWSSPEWRKWSLVGGELTEAERKESVS